MKKFYVFGLALAAPLLFLSILGVVYLYRSQNLFWLIPISIVWQAAAVFILFKVKPWGLSYTQQTAVSLGWDEIKDEEALAIVEELKREVAEGNYTINQQAFFDLTREMVEHIASHYHPRAKNPLMKVKITLLLKAIEEAAGDMAHLSRKVPLARFITIEDLKKGKRIWVWGKTGYQIFRFVSPFINPKGALLREALDRLVFSRFSQAARDNMEKGILMFFLDRLGYHLIRLYGEGAAGRGGKP